MGLAALVTGAGEPVTVVAHGLGASIAETRPLAGGVAGARVFVTAPGHCPGALPDTAVTYAAQPAANFSPPPGFHRMEMPTMPPGMGGKPGKFPG